jgi:hypothetical protein
VLSGKALVVSLQPAPSSAHSSEGWNPNRQGQETMMAVCYRYTHALELPGRVGQPLVSEQSEATLF